MKCSVDQDLTNYLKQQEENEKFSDAVDELRDEMAEEFLLGNLQSEDCAEIFSELASNPEFSSTIMDIFKTLSDINITRLKIAKLFLICKNASLPYFEDLAVAAIESQHDH